MSKWLSAVLVLTVLATTPAMAAIETYRCMLTEVAVWPTRIHIQCAGNPSSSPGIIFFAVPTSSSVIPNPSDNASRFLQVALAALKNPDAELLVQFDSSDYSGAGFGCATVNCRYASSIFLKSPPILP
jgi:hypothetical protein